MKKLFRISVLILLTFSVFAQTKLTSFKQSFSGADKRVMIFSASNRLTIEGTTGTEVIIETGKPERDIPEEAEGLKMVTPGGMTDNTGIGANVVVEGNTLRIKLPKSRYSGDYILKIPKTLNISVKEVLNSYATWEISGMSGEVETETSFSSLKIKNVSGPIVAHGGYGKIYVEYDQLNQTRPNSITSSGSIDITLPADTKANLKVQTMYADFFTDFDIIPSKVEVVEKAPKGNIRYTTYNNQTVYINENGAYDRFGKKFGEADYTKIIEAEDAKRGKVAKAQSSDLAKDLAKVDIDLTSSELTTTLKDKRKATKDDCNCSDGNAGATVGTINGGGVNLIIKSNFENIYLRKKK